MGGRAIALVAVGSGLVAAAAWAQTGQVVSGPTVLASHKLPAGAITGFTGRVPAWVTSPSAAVSRSPATARTLLSVRPAGTRRLHLPLRQSRHERRHASDRRRRLPQGRGGPVLRLTPVKTKVVVRPGASVAGPA
jgi:hypothetical protein